MIYNSLMTRFIFSFILFFCICNPTLAKDLPRPKLMLANVYHEGLDLSDYWVSEKYDGVRTLWDGKQFISRGGNIYHAPEWFTIDFPNQHLDGELWISRQSFELLVSTVRDNKPDSEAWGKVKFMVFDMPNISDTFDHRFERLVTLIKTTRIPWLTLVDQIKLKDHATLMKHLHKLTQAGAEGLMLHKGSSLYRAKRSGDLLKLKPYEDAEAIVVEHITGKGKYKNMLGAIRVVLSNGDTFKIGTGFTDAERADPPKIGTMITYQFRGKTKNGIPRFASFLRERIDAEDKK
ncbi:MAG: DNA ligase-1 [Cocleimonas sp.]|jgi:DNA ligase-1